MVINLIWEVRICYKQGVLDAEGESTLRGLKALGFKNVEKVSTAKIFRIKGNVKKEEVEEMCKRLLANPISQHYEILKIED